MWKHAVRFALLGLLSPGVNIVSAFVIHPSPLPIYESSLFAVRQPRRFLKKRKGRERKSPANHFGTAAPNPGDTIEIKPLVPARQKEAGEDFWIDPIDLAKEKERQQAIANRQAMEGEMPKEKLIEEVVAPYKQNWIGFLSVAVVILAAIVTSFPEMLENPTISLPDLDAGDPIPLESMLKRAVLSEQ